MSEANGYTRVEKNLPQLPLERQELKGEYTGNDRIHDEQHRPLNLVQASGPLKPKIVHQKEVYRSLRLLALLSSVLERIEEEKEKVWSSPPNDIIC